MSRIPIQFVPIRPHNACPRPMPSSRPTFEHFKSKPVTVDARLAPMDGSIPPHRMPIGRLCYGPPDHGPHPCPDEKLAELIERSAEADTCFFLDTSFVTAHECEPAVWEALRKKQIYLTPEVRLELQPWLDQPFCNIEFHERVTVAIADPDSQPGLVILDRIGDETL